MFNEIATVTAVGSGPALGVYFCSVLIVGLKKKQSMPKTVRSWHMLCLIISLKETCLGFLACCSDYILKGKCALHKCFSVLTEVSQLSFLELFFLSAGIIHPLRNSKDHVAVTG